MCEADFQADNESMPRAETHSWMTEGRAEENTASFSFGIC